MVVQHILAVRRGTREACDLNKEDKNLLDDNESEIKKENEIIEKDISNEKIDEISKEKLDETIEDKCGDMSIEKPGEESNDKSVAVTIKTELDEIETNIKSEQKLEESIDNSMKNIEIDEYYVKYRNFSYLHCEWKTEEELTKGDKRIAAKLKRFKQKMANNTNIFENVRFYNNYDNTFCICVYI